jgi:DNA segregation ATPase FtsK/SpoIIIE, S-DNA-T family
MSDADAIDQAWGTGSVAKPLRTPLWQVNTRGRKVLEMTDAELLAAYKAGKLTAKSLVWSEGMPEWAPLGEVPRITALVRADSVPPASGTRPVADESPPSAGSSSYASPGSEPPTSPGTSPGTLAVYERPLATIVFPDADDAPESSDEPTPAFGMPSKAAVEAALEAREPIPGRTTLVDGAFEPAPPLPPLPPRASSAFPTPVSASPLGAALSSTVSPTPPPAPIRSDGYATAKATAPIARLPPKVPTAGPAPVVVRTSLPSTASASAPSTAPGAPSAAKITTPLPATLGAQSAAKIITPLPGLGSWPATKIITPLPTVGSPEAPQAFAAPPPPALPVVEKAVTSAAPRPAIEFLPPIIVQEKDDDGASVIELPPEAQRELDAHRALEAGVSLQDVPFHESTLVLSGRRPKRWVPLTAAIAAAVGAACLASALTALIVKTRPEPPPRIVEKRVLVPAPAAVAEVPTPAAALPTAEPEATTPARKESKATGANASTASKSEASTASPKASWKREDPGTLDEREASEPTAAGAPRRELRAGFPTNPGF